MLTWNVQGSHGVDVDAVAGVVRAVEPDLVALQEVQRRHVAALASAMSMSTRRWAFKHWPVVQPPEGLAVLTPHRLVRATTFHLRRAPFWSWKRRIGIDATVEADGHELRVIDVHLSSHDLGQRSREAAAIVARAGGLDPAPIIVGDLNDGPDLSAPAELARAGWLDAWAEVNGADGGATNWTPGERAGRVPTQRLDYVFAPPGSLVGACTIPIDHERLDSVAALSDHLPLVATIRLP